MYPIVDVDYPAYIANPSPVTDLNLFLLFSDNCWICDWGIDKAMDLRKSDILFSFGKENNIEVELRKTQSLDFTRAQPL